MTPEAEDRYCTWPLRCPFRVLVTQPGSFSEVDARIGEVCFAPINGLPQPSLSGPKSAGRRNASSVL